MKVVFVDKEKLKKTYCFDCGKPVEKKSAHYDGEDWWHNDCHTVFVNKMRRARWKK